MGSNVFLQRAEACEHLLALPTLVRFILTVHWEVDFEISGTCKTPATLIALKWLLTCNIAKTMFSVR